jgi:hypothetical protein
VFRVLGGRGRGCERDLVSAVGRIGWWVADGLWLGAREARLTNEKQTRHEM